MRKFLVILLCLMLVITACGTKEKVPEGMSKEFYHAMLEMDEEIQKNIATKGNEKKIPEGMSEEFYHAMLIMDKEIQESLKTKELRLTLDNKKYNVVFTKYIIPIINDKLPEEIVKGLIEQGYYMGVDNMKEKEKLTADALSSTQIELEGYFDRIKEKREPDIIKICREAFEEEYKIFRSLLELQ